MEEDTCRYGHPLTEENSYLKKGRSKPGCRICRSNESKRYRNGTTPAKPITHRWYGDTCIRGHILSPETAGERITPAGKRLWCKECVRQNHQDRKSGENLVRQRKMGDLCPAGLHILTPETARIYRNDKSPTCMPCKRDRDKQYKLANPEKVANRRAESRRRKHRAKGVPEHEVRPRPTQASMSGAHTRRRQERRILQVAVEDERLLGDELSKADDERPSAPWNVMRPTGKARESLERLNAALDSGLEGNCRDNPEPWMDSWLDEDEDGNVAPPPAPNRVRAMCAGCPVLAQCGEYGIVSRDPGVWGGVRIAPDGRIYD